MNEDYYKEFENKIKSLPKPVFRKDYLQTKTNWTDKNLSTTTPIRNKPKTKQSENLDKVSYNTTFSRTQRTLVFPKSPQKLSTPISRVFTKQEQTPHAPFQIESNQALISPFYDQSLSLSFFEQTFQNISLIGEGSFGQVFRVCSKENHKVYAIKRVIKRSSSLTNRQKQLNEVNYLKTLQNHPHCVRYDAAWDENGILYIQTEWCNGGSLVSQEHSSISEGVIWQFVTDLSLGLQHIHNNNIVHLDIKPANIFIVNQLDNGFNGSIKKSLKIGDYGISYDISKNNPWDPQEGDNRYMALELLEGRFGKEADIFSFGITILEMAANVELPSMGESWIRLRHDWQPELDKNYSKSLANFIRWLMAHQPENRPTVEEILLYPNVISELNTRKNISRFSYKSNVFVYSSTNSMINTLEIFHQFNLE